MRRREFDGLHSDWIGDLPAWLMEHSETNDEQMERLRRNLKRVRERELTARQRQVLALYYDRKMNIPPDRRRAGREPVHHLPDHPAGQKTDPPLLTIQPVIHFPSCGFSPLPV